MGEKRPGVSGPSAGAARPCCSPLLGRWFLPAAHYVSRTRLPAPLPRACFTPAGSSTKAGIV